MLEDQRGLSAGHVRVGIEVLDHERPQIVGVPRGDVQEEIVGTGQKVPYSVIVATSGGMWGIRCHGAASNRTRSVHGHRFVPPQMALPSSGAIGFISV